MKKETKNYNEICENYREVQRELSNHLDSFQQFNNVAEWKAQAEILISKRDNLKSEIDKFEKMENTKMTFMVNGAKWSLNQIGEITNDYNAYYNLTTKESNFKTFPNEVIKEAEKHNDFILVE